MGASTDSDTGMFFGLEAYLSNHQEQSSKLGRHDCRGEYFDSCLAEDDGHHYTIPAEYGIPAGGGSAVRRTRVFLGTGSSCSPSSTVALPMCGCVLASNRPVCGLYSSCLFFSVDGTVDDRFGNRSV